MRGPDPGDVAQVEEVVDLGGRGQELLSNEVLTLEMSRRLKR